MTSILAIPFNDVIMFLRSRDIDTFSDREQAYLKLWNLIQADTLTNIPLSIADWIIAYNLAIQQVLLPQYKTSEILLTNHTNLLSLATKLTLLSVDKQRIIRILSY